MELIVVSDLHLSAGYDDQTKKYCRNEDFFFDEEFKRFLEYLQRQNSLNKRYFHLIIAGDMFDFLQVNGQQAEELHKKGGASFEITRRERRFGLGTEADKTVWKLGLIAKGHEVFFEALANFLSKGNLLSIITGNHDIELYWPGVRSELVRLVGLRHPSKAQQIEDSIRFYPWFYYDKDYKTYIEHGNQYDPLNSFQYFLYPRLEPGSDKLWLPFGSFFVRYFFNKLEISNPFADNMKPPTKYLRWAWKEDKLEFLRNIISYFFTMLRLFLKGGRPDSAITSLKRRLFKSTEKLPKSLREFNIDMLEQLAQDFRLKPETVSKIYSLRAPPFRRNDLWVILHFLGATLFICTPIVFILLFTLAKTLNFSTWIAIISSLGSFIVPIIGKWIYASFHKDIFETILPKIKTYLADVQIIVFGHIHDPKIEIHDKEFSYFNTGTWTTVFSEEERIIREEKQFAFVWIKKEKDGTLDSTLCRWNDCARRHEKLILFEPKSSRN